VGFSFSRRVEGGLPRHVIGDTIAALATPAGQGALSIVRLSGPSALSVADACFEGRRRPSEMPSHTVQYGSVLDAEGRTLDRVLLTVMRGPRTSTGEDTVEISGHGGRFVSAVLLDRVLACGARLAGPGEFTRRAFLNGRMDLIQAEGVLEVVRARNETGLRAALRQIDGRASLDFDQLRQKLDLCRAQLECAIEFAEETGPWSDEDIRAKIEETARELESVLGRARAGRRIQDGVSVAIVGKPNVGKSTLFNRLVGEDRVIVSEEPGTTRDAVAEWIEVSGVPVRLVDTAGIRAARSRIEGDAVVRAREQAGRAELILIVIDGSQAPDGEDEEILGGCDLGRSRVILNKMDLGICGPAEAWVRERAGGCPVDRVSALNLEGIEELREKIGLEIGSASDPDEYLMSSLRQIDIMRRTLVSLERCASVLREGLGIELAASDMMESIEIFGDIAGTTTTEEMLDRIFHEFCIGK
jgi:tRNA modification GTPase